MSAGRAPPLDASSLWWADYIAQEPHLADGWVQEGIVELRREFAPPEPPPEDAELAAAKADVDARATEYATRNEGTSMRNCPAPPQRLGARDTYRRLCIEAGARINASVVLMLEDATTHEVLALDASKTYLGDKGAIVLCRLLSVCPNVSMVVLQGLLLGQQPILALCKEASRHPKLRSVDLRGNFVEHPTAKALHRMLCTNSNIEHLHCDGCGVNAGVLRQIDDRLRQNTRINANRLGTAHIP